MGSSYSIVNTQRPLFIATEKDAGTELIIKVS